ncbi:hypothetical protein BJ322DRAFT_676511 [Thelephora terrestris]|uniref:Uncharacterized protein n=1 Tax=Thelephora terrestris TaxID=56493 RepID=A0A9P6HIA9_9AGAM|nr:hypothetical protein BJ322DRAFT_676511 [Thelephora terrestris]
MVMGSCNYLRRTSRIHSPARKISWEPPGPDRCLGLNLTLNFRSPLESPVWGSNGVSLYVSPAPCFDPQHAFNMGFAGFHDKTRLLGPISTLIALLRLRRWDSLPRTGAGRRVIAPARGSRQWEREGRNIRNRAIKNKEASEISSKNLGHWRLPSS